MKREFSRITALAMALVMTLSVVPQALGANNTDQLTINAPGPEITVVGNETALDPFAGVADLTYSIQRDYEQNVWIPLKNTTNSLVRYYMTVDNAEDYPDLSMNFVAFRNNESDPKGQQGGFRENPGYLFGAAGSTPAAGGALLKVFAQEAIRESYDIRVTFHDLGGNAAASKTIKVNIGGYGMTLGSAVGAAAPDGSVEVTLTNNGADAINSLNVDLNKTLEPYACLPALIQNYSLGAGSSVTFKVAPTAKLAYNQTVSGNLLVVGNGETKEVAISLTGPLAKTTTGNELAESAGALGTLTASENSLTATPNASDGSLDISLSMESGKSGVGPIPVKATVKTTVITEGTAQPTLPSDAEDVETLDNGSKFWIDAPTVSGKKISIKLYHWIPVANTMELSSVFGAALEGPEAVEAADTRLSGEEDTGSEVPDPSEGTDGAGGLADAEPSEEAPIEETAPSQNEDGQDAGAEPQAGDDAVTGILKEFDLEIDLSNAGINDEFIEEYANAVAKDPDLNSINNAPLPPKTKGRAIAYRQMEMLLELLRDHGTEQQKQAILDAFNKDLPDAAKKNSLDDYYQEFKNAVDAYMKNAKLTRHKVVTPYQPDNNGEKDYGDNDKSDWSSIDINEKGSQCTNRGKITSSFHSTNTLGPGRSIAMFAADDVTMAADKGIRIFYTGRINSEDKYINFEPITYDLSVKTSQGTQSIGTSVNTGLSELNIIELDSTKIPMGETIAFTRDYDINPGTHFVTTDNRFTIVYPADAEVPDDATGVHLAVPDFDVYKKNIFLLDEHGNYVKEGIVGQNKLHVSVSNRGAKGGYYQLSVTSDQGGSALVDDAAQGKYRYLPAFATQVLELDVNLSAVSQDITVSVADCSKRTRETDTGNNSATYAISARARQVPTVVSVTPANGAAISGVRTSLGVSLTNAEDVAGAAFTLTKSDGSPAYSKRIEIPGSGYFTTEQLDLEAGTTYTMKVDIDYLTGGMFQSSTGTVSSTTTFTTPTNTTWAGITLPDGSTIRSEDPEWALYTVNTSGGTTSYTPYKSSASYNASSYDVAKQGDGSYALTLWGTDGSLNGKLLTVYDPVGYALYAGMVGAQGAAIDMTERRSLVLEGAEFSSRTVSVTEAGRTSRTVAVEADKKTVWLPSIPVSISGRLNVGGASYWFSQSLKESDYVAGKYTFTVGGESSSVAKYTFTVPQGLEYAGYYVYKTRETDTDYDYQQLQSGVSGTTLTMLLNKGNLEGTVYQPSLLVCTDGGDNEVPAVYVIPAADYTEGMSLAGLNTHRLTLTAQDPSRLRIGSIEVEGFWGSYPQMYSYGNPSVLCTPGTYTVQISYTYDGISYSVNKTVDLSSGDQTIDLSTGLADMAQLELSWDASLGSASLYFYGGRQSYSYDFYDQERASIRIPEGTYSGTVYCYAPQNSAHCEFTLDNLALSKAAPVSKHLGAALTGQLKIKSPAAGTELNTNDYVTMTVSNVADSSGNKLQSCSGANGYVIFTPKDGGDPVVRRVSIPSQFEEDSRISVRLPSKAGAYTTSFSTVSPLAGDYVIRASAGEGGTIAPSGSTWVMSGEGATFTITPNAGYTISSVLVDGTDVGARSSYTFSNVTDNHTISASFQKVSSVPGPSQGTGGTGGSSSDDDRESVRVSSVSHGKLTVSPKDAKRGDTVKITAVPDAGYELKELQVLNGKRNEVALTKTGENVYTFTMPGGTVTVRGSFALKAAESAGEQAGNPFTDVSASDWFYGDVMFAYENNLFRGTSATQFSPNGIMSRAMFVTVLSRFETLKNGTVIKGDSTFTDVPAGQWCSDSVAWAADLKITSGYADGRFGKNNNVTREQACTFLVRYLKASGVDLTAYSQPLTFTDAEQVSSWAKESVAIAQQIGLVQGRSDGRFDPRGNMSRAACAAVFHRLGDFLE